MEKRCARCQLIREFSPKGKHCKICASAMAMKWAQEHPERVKITSARWYQKNKERVQQYSKARREVQRHQYRARRRRNPALALWRNVKQRAKKLGVEFTLTPQDIQIPLICPALGLPLVVNEQGFSDTSPSVDRLDPNLGYTPENIRIISLRANCLKKDATLTELEMLVRWMRKQCQT